METKDEPSDEHDPCSDIGSSEKKTFEENAAKEAPVLSSSDLEAGTNQDSIKETEGEDAEASDGADVEQTRNTSGGSSGFSTILGEIDANPKILETDDDKRKITFLGYQDITPLAFNPAALRQMDSISESIEISNQEPESLKGRKQEAIKLGVELTYLVVEAMFLATDELLDKTEDELRKSLKAANDGPLDVKGIVVYNLTKVFNGMKAMVKAHSLRPVFDPTKPSQDDRFFERFSDVVSRLEEVIRCIRNLSRTKTLEDEPEKLSDLDREIEDCRSQLVKIGVEIAEVKQLYFNSKHALSSDSPRGRILRTAKLEEPFFALWNSLFQSGKKRKASPFDKFFPDSSDSEDSVSQPSIQ